MDGLTVRGGKTELYLDPATLALRVTAAGGVWESDPARPPRVETACGEVLFSSAEIIEHKPWETGLGKGIHSAYRSVPGLGGLSFDTVVWIEDATGDVIFEFIPMGEAVNVAIRNIRYPAPFVLEGAGAYSALTFLQGVLLPNDWDRDFPKMPFDGQMCSESAYMPWWGQVRADGGYIAIVDQPWDARYTVAHPAGGPTSIGIGWMPTLGRVGYRRTMRFVFLPRCDHNDLCAVYRRYAQERGLLITLREKAARTAHVDRLVGSAVVHLGIKSHRVPGGRYYNADEPEKNDSLIPFARRAQQMQGIAAMGIAKAYLHLDGWGQPGYDNQHPDYLPACAEAGGWEGLRALSETCASLGFLFGLHDQYRDYYLDAKTYDPRMAVHLADGTLYGHAIWAGGRQNYLCPSQQPMYVKRNFEEILRNGVHLDATYLDVFTCNEQDECAQPLHAVTRKECAEYRRQCFDYLLARGILPSSEEVVDWAMPSLVFCHWAPYAKADAGIPVPLLNLVYHDCVIIPWMLGKGAWGTPPDELGFLHAILNGGIGYLNPELEGEELAANLERVRVVGALHERVGKLPMTRHEFLSADRRKQRTVFADGTAVTVDFDAETWEIAPGV